MAETVKIAAAFDKLLDVFKERKVRRVGFGQLLPVVCGASQMGQAFKSIGLKNEIRPRFSLKHKHSRDARFDQRI